MRIRGALAVLIGVLGACLPCAAFAQVRMALDVGGNLGGWADVTPKDHTDDVTHLPTAGVKFRLGAVAEHLSAGATLSSSVNLAGPASASAGAYAGPAINTRSGTRIELLATGGVQLHYGIGDEHAGHVQTGSAALPFVGGEVSVWMPTASPDTLVGFYVEGRTDLARQTVTETVTPSCFLCILGPEPASYTARDEVGGASLFVGVQLRLDKIPHVQRKAPVVARVVAADEAPTSVAEPTPGEAGPGGSPLRLAMKQVASGSDVIVGLTLTNVGRAPVAIATNPRFGHRLFDSQREDAFEIQLIGERGRWIPFQCTDPLFDPHHAQSALLQPGQSRQFSVSLSHGCYDLVPGERLSFIATYATNGLPEVRLTGKVEVVVPTGWPAVTDRSQN